MLDSYRNYYQTQHFFANHKKAKPAKQVK